MSYNNITKGNKVARPLSARIIKSGKGTLGFEVEFSFHEESIGGEERIRWTGWLSENALENTMATLVNVLGYSGNDEINEDGTLKDPNVLNWLKEVKLVIEMEEYNGKSRAKVKWVNALGGGGFQAAESSSLKNELKALGFTAAFLAAKQKLSATPVKKESVPASDVPF